MVARRDIPFRVPSYSVWKPKYDARLKDEIWKITSLFYYEVSTNKMVRSVRIHCFGGLRDGMILHLSEERLLRCYTQIV